MDRGNEKGFRKRKKVRKDDARIMKNNKRKYKRKKDCKERKRENLKNK